MAKTKIGVVFAMDEEAQPLLRILGLTVYEEPYKNARFYIGRDTVIGVGGVGTLAACMCAHALIRDYGCTLIFNTGSCGATGSRYKIGDIVSVTSVYKGDVDLTVAGYAPCELPNTPVRLSPLPDPSFPAACDRSSDKFIVRTDNIEKDIVAEMEAFPVAYVCMRMGVPCRIYKVVSDLTEKNEDSSQFDVNLGEVSLKLAEHVSGIISDILAREAP